ncbi:MULTISPECIES: alpha/beta hydrolase [Limnospira]|uniref:alpha/beta hydrolase n=1 Tax=Limnospira TaxID=2596745 RepID=UPI000558D09A|nr:alpha/beta hydrolase [Limnospira sp. PMC 917.15]MDT9236677.1 alpha/beta hydrolase [Limnospira sp. PMC 917.15]UWU45432.1 putative dienelactone hydrolase [Arthrospira platensis C1]
MAVAGKWFSSVWQIFGVGLSSAILSAIASVSPAHSAEEMIISYGIANTSISIAELEKFVESGESTPLLFVYGYLLNIEDPEGLRRGLKSPFEASPWSIDRFLNSPTGETILRRMGRVVNTGDGENGYMALKTAIAQASKRPEGLTIMGILQEFPDPQIRIDLDFSIDLINETTQVLFRDQTIIEQISQQRSAENSANRRPQQRFTIPNPRTMGPYSWTEAEVVFFNPNRDRPSPLFLYLPENIDRPAPLIIISHGLGSDPKTFSYLAEHLASHGFAVAIPEHIATSANRFEGFLQGFEEPPNPSEFAARPTDISYLLDLLEQKSASNPFWRERLDLQNVGVVGQSFGGYTVLALAGAKLNPQILSQYCPDLPNRRITLNLSIILQCRALEVALERQNFRDPRIKAAIAINPFSSLVFGERGMAAINIPVAIVSGTNDYITPAIAEQIEPFTWLTNSDNILVLFEGGTHFSFLQEEGGQLPIPPEIIGPDPNFAYPYLKALSLTFFNLHIRRELDNRNYLNDAYLNTIGSSLFQMTILEELTPEQLQRAFPQP